MNGRDPVEAVVSAVPGDGLQSTDSFESWDTGSFWCNKSAAGRSDHLYNKCDTVQTFRPSGDDLGPPV